MAQQSRKLPPRHRQLTFKSIMSQTRKFSYTPKLRKFVGKNAGTMTRAKRLIDTNMAKLENGQLVKSADGRVRAVRWATGEHKGYNNIITLRVEAGNRLFFVKISPQHREAEHDRYAHAELVLRKYGRKIGGFNMRVIVPHLIYSAPANKTLRLPARSFLVSDFIDERRVVQPQFYKGKRSEALLGAIEDASKLLKREGVHLDSPQFNSFYEEKTNTVYLFDI